MSALPTPEECKSVADADAEYWINIAKDVGRWGNHESINQRGISILKPDHRFSGIRGYVYAHRLIYEEYYKCCLLPWARVHHINRNNQDNRIENLEVRIRILCRSDHKCITCGDGQSSKKQWTYGMCNICAMKEYHLKHDIKSDNKCITCGVQTRIRKNGRVRRLCTYCIKECRLKRVTYQPDHKCIKWGGQNILNKHGRKQWCHGMCNKCSCKYYRRHKRRLLAL